MTFIWLVVFPFFLLVKLISLVSKYFIENNFFQQIRSPAGISFSLNIINFEDNPHLFNTSSNSPAKCSVPLLFFFFQINDHLHIYLFPLSYWFLDIHARITELFLVNPFPPDYLQILLHNLAFLWLVYSCYFFLLLLNHFSRPSGYQHHLMLHLHSLFNLLLNIYSISYPAMKHLY